MLSHSLTFFFTIQNTLFRKNIGVFATVSFVINPQIQLLFIQFPQIYAIRIVSFAQLQFPQMQYSIEYRNPQISLIISPAIVCSEQRVFPQKFLRTERDNLKTIRFTGTIRLHTEVSETIWKLLGYRNYQVIYRRRSNQM